MYVLDHGLPDVTVVVSRLHQLSGLGRLARGVVGVVAMLRQQPHYYPVSRDSPRSSLWLPRSALIGTNPEAYFRIARYTAAEALT
jgi:hypothetical protein